jgi:hypothetical protein
MAVGICEKHFSLIGQSLMGSSRDKVRPHEKPKFRKKFRKTEFQNFSLKHVSRYLMCSICGKNFSPIGLTFLEIQKWSKKRWGVPLNPLITLTLSSHPHSHQNPYESAFTPLVVYDSTACVRKSISMKL